jgi:arginine/lysine/histidine/glutamine transport system substrate-binding and permease protein
MHRWAHSGRVSLFACAVLLLNFTLVFAQSAPMVDHQPEALSLAMSGAFQPYSTTDENGQLTGFDADIAREIAIRLGKKPELVQTDWAGIQAGLQSRKYDLICGSMAITAERLETMHFSLPYYVSGAQVFVKEGVASLKGIRIGVTEDSTYADYIQTHPGQFAEAKVVTYGSEAEIVAAMNTDKIEAFVSDRIVGGFYVQKGGSGKIVPFGGLLYQESCGIAARQDSAELVHRVNRALFEMIQDGTYSAIYSKWVGSAPDLEVLLASWGEFTEHIPQVDNLRTASSGDKPGFADSASAMLPLLAKGAVLTIELTLITAILALLTGSLLGVGTVSRRKWIKGLSLFYIWLIRGTPLLVQLFISYFVLATLVNRLAGTEVVGAFGAALIALVVNTTAYNAETLRGGINGVDKGQWDAAASLGMPRPKILRRVILPQAFADALPSLGNNLVVLTKDTSLVGAITLIELTYSARNVVFQTGQAFLPFVLAAAFYLAIISVITVSVNVWERRLQRSRQAVGRSI